MRRAGWMALGMVLALAAAQCGYPTFVFDGVGSTGGGGASSCQSCGASDRCTILDTSTGKTGCVPVSSSHLAPYAACPSGDGDCPAGTWCDGRTRVCMPFCAPGSTCKGGGSCVAASAGTAVVPGNYVCTAHCEPISAKPCGAGATCIYDPSVLDFDCFESNQIALSAVCSQPNDCASGLVCGFNQTLMQATCLEWCSPAGDYTCAGSAYCTDFASPVAYDGTSYGYCN